MRWWLALDSASTVDPAEELEHLAPALRSDRALAERFRRFAAEECSEASDEGAGSRTYEILSEAVAVDRALPGLARRCRFGQPIPNLFFAAVKRTVAFFPGSELAEHYRRIAAGDGPTADLEQAFTEFALAHRDQIIGYLESRMVQTNEVGRCAYLLPGFLTIAAENPGLPLALLDVGASAGLNLNWDQYRYRYSTGDEFGPANSRVVIECDARNGLPELPTAFPEVSFRVGIDLAPVNLGDDEEYRWMQALVWPEHRERAAALSSARDVWIHSRPTVLQGDTVELLPDTLRDIPEDSALCVFHCHTLNQFPAAARERFADILRAESMERVVYHFPSEGERVALRKIVAGTAQTRFTARRQVHGKWIEWDTDPTVSAE